MRGMIRGRRAASSAAIALVTALALCPLRARASPVSTVGDLIARATGVSAAIEQLTTGLGAEGRSIGNGVGASVNGAVAQLREIVGNDLNRQIATLTGAAAAMAAQIQSTTDQLDVLLAKRTKCGFEGADRFLSGTKTLAAQLTNALPLVKSSAPFLSWFQFDSHDAGVVPSEGGRVAIRGLSLWTDNEVGPSVALIDGNMRTLSALEPQRDRDNDSLSVRIDGDKLRSHAGECLRVRVVPRVKRGHWIFWSRIEEQGEMLLPLCIPKTTSTRFQARAQAVFTCEGRSGPTPLETFALYCENTDCSHRNTCHSEHAWAVAQNCSIDNFSKEKGSIYRNHCDVTERVVGTNQIVADGTCDEASCVLGRRLHHTVYQMMVTPTITCRTNSTPQVSALSELQLINENGGNICFKVPRPCEEQLASWTVEVFSSTADNEPTKVLTLPSVTTSGPVAMPIPSADYSGLHVRGHVTPRVGDASEVCINISSDSCGY